MNTEQKLNQMIETTEFLIDDVDLIIPVVVEQNRFRAEKVKAGLLEVSHRLRLIKTTYAFKSLSTEIE